MEMGMGGGEVTISPSQKFSASRKSVRGFKVGNLEMKLSQVHSLVTRRTVYNFCTVKPS